MPTQVAPDERKEALVVRSVVRGELAKQRGVRLEVSRQWRALVEPRRAVAQITRRRCPLCRRAGGGVRVEPRGESGEHGGGVARHLIERDVEEGGGGKVRPPTLDRVGVLTRSGTHARQGGTRTRRGVEIWSRSGGSERRCVRAVSPLGLTRPIRSKAESWPLGKGAAHSGKVGQTPPPRASASSQRLTTSGARESSTASRSEAGG
eukprot:5497880-Prymnesium_polylepis.1